MQFSHLNEHNFRHGFNTMINPICRCVTEVDTNEHFFLRCHCFSGQTSELFDKLYILDPSISKLNNKKKVASLLCGSPSNPNTKSLLIL